MEASNRNVSVRVLFFGATADVAGVREAVIKSPDGEKSFRVFEEIFRLYPALKEKHDSSPLRFSVNQAYSSGDEIVRDGDELAVFTAVSGG